MPSECVVRVFAYFVGFFFQVEERTRRKFECDFDGIDWNTDVCDGAIRSIYTFSLWMFRLSFPSGVGVSVDGNNNNDNLETSAFSGNI